VDLDKLTQPGVLEAASLRLALLGVADVPDMQELTTDEAVRRETRVPRQPEPGFAETWVKRYTDGLTDGTRVGFSIRDRETGSFLGFIGLVEIKKVEAEAEVGYTVAPGARGRGVAKEALRRISAWAIDEVGIERLELLIRDGNEPSRHVAEGSGYQREGLLRSLYFKGDERIDMFLYSRIASDDPRREQAKP
jgi:RimJ/RimL family protein N-acetyltransferase